MPLTVIVSSRFLVLYGCSGYLLTSTKGVSGWSPTTTTAPATRSTTALAVALQPQEQAPRKDAPQTRQGPRGYSGYRRMNYMDGPFPFDEEDDMMMLDGDLRLRDPLPPPFWGGPGPYDFEIGFPPGPGMNHFDMEYNDNIMNRECINFGMDFNRMDQQGLPPPIPRMPAKTLTSRDGPTGTILSSHHLPYGGLDSQRRQERYGNDDFPRKSAAPRPSKMDKKQGQQSRSVELERESSARRRSGLDEENDDRYDEAYNFDALNRRKNQPSGRQWGLDEEDDSSVQPNTRQSTRNRHRDEEEDDRYDDKQRFGIPDDSGYSHYDEDITGHRRHLFETAVTPMGDDLDFGFDDEDVDRSENRETYRTRQVERDERPLPSRPEPKKQEPPKPKVVVLSNNPSLVSLSSFLGSSETPRKGFDEVVPSLCEDEIEEDEMTKHTSSARKYIKNKHRETIQKAKESREKKRLKLKLEATRKQLMGDAIVLLNQDSSVTSVLGSDIELLDDGEPFSEKTSVASSDNVFASETNPRTTYGFRVGGSKHTGIVQLVTLRNSNFDITASEGIMITQLTVEGGGRRIQVKLRNGAGHRNNGKAVPISKKKQNPVFQRPSTNREGGFSQLHDVIQGASDSIIDGVIEIAAKENDETEKV